jgi:hypothetical protein
MPYGRGEGVDAMVEFAGRFVFFVDGVRMRTLLKRDKIFHASRKPQQNMESGKTL